MVVMFDIFRDGMMKRCFAEEDHAVEAFGFDRANESFGEGVQIRASQRQCFGFDAYGSKDHVEPGSKFGVAVAEQIIALGKQIATGTRQVAGGLPHPFIGGIRRDSAEVDLAAADVDEEQDVMGDQTECGPDFGGEEVGCQQAIGVRLDEIGPTGFAFPHWRWIDAVFLKNVFDGLVAQTLAEIEQSPANPSISAGRILAGELKDSFNHRGVGRWAVDSFGFAAFRRVELFGDQLAVPAENRFGRDDTGNGIKSFATELFTDLGECDACPSVSFGRPLI